MDLKALGGTMLCQKDAFLCAAKGVSVGIGFQKKLGAGFFGGEGFILQKLEGDGLAFAHACGAIIEKKLNPGETLRIDTGCLVAFEPSVNYDIQFVSGVKTALFGGEGLFYASLTGPGRVWLCSPGGGCGKRKCTVFDCVIVLTRSILFSILIRLCTCVALVFLARKRSMNFSTWAIFFPWLTA